MKKRYTHIGKCIFCKCEEPEVSFFKRPHILPKSMGGEIIGVDICDNCNGYFGCSDTLIKVPPRWPVEVCVKEIIGIARYLFLKHEKNARYKSKFFNIWESKHTIDIIHTNLFSKDSAFLTRQFKRGLYELFLQAYHNATYDGLNPQFDKMRNFARFNEGDMSVYYVINRGAYLVASGMIEHPLFPMTNHMLQEMNDTGFYEVYLGGHIFFLEIADFDESSRDIALQKLYNKHHIGGVLSEALIRIDSINQIDFTLNELYHYNYSFRPHR